jgi:SAM-dependent methyltransferase
MATKKLRDFLTAVYKLRSRIEAPFDRWFLDRAVPLMDHHAHYAALSAEYNRPGMRVLELGSREVTGASDARQRFGEASYVGFDYFPGPNVDVVGDAHRLASYFAPDEKFDLIYSIACFEHFAMPWVVATEMAKLLKVGGSVFIATHFSYSSHARPWHFFQFSDMALRVLFPIAMGFECIDAGASDPMVGRFSAQAARDLRFRPIIGLYCGSAYLGRKVRDVPGFTWETADLASLVGGTSYPLE